MELARTRFLSRQVLSGLDRMGCSRFQLQDQHVFISHAPRPAELIDFATPNRTG